MDFTKLLEDSLTESKKKEIVSLDVDITNGANNLYDIFSDYPSSIGEEENKINLTYPSNQKLTEDQSKIVNDNFEKLKKVHRAIYDKEMEFDLGEYTHHDFGLLYKKVKDTQTDSIVELNNLRKGKYSVVCKAGPAFQSKQQETVTAINEMATIDPTILQIGSDVLLNNITAPGIDQIAERKRLMMVAQGVIPQSQMTEEEKKISAEQNAKKGEMSPLDQANLMIAQAQAQDIQGKNQERQTKLQLEEQKLQLKKMELAMKQRAEDRKLELDQQQQLVDAVTSATEQLKTQAETLKLIREAMGVETIVGGAPLAAFNEQATELTKDLKTQ